LKTGIHPNTHHVRNLGAEGTPDPIPNSVVKPLIAESTAV